MLGLFDVGIFRFWDVIGIWDLNVRKQWDVHGFDLGLFNGIEI